MTNEDKVIQAYSIAVLSKQISQTRFEVIPGSVSYISFNGKTFMEFDKQSDATKIANKLNDALNTVLLDIKTYYDKKIQDILNA